MDDVRDALREIMRNDMMPPADRCHAAGLLIQLRREFGERASDPESYEPSPAALFDELRNMVLHPEGVWPGATISHSMAEALVARGWARRSGTDGNFVPTNAGARAFFLWVDTKHAGSHPSAIDAIGATTREERG